MELLDWKNLPFQYLKTDCNVRCYYEDGKWGALEETDSEYINMHIAATSIHYGQQCFEGLKAYRGKDDRVRLFRWQENAKRMQLSATGIRMPEVPTEIFEQAIKRAVILNKRFIPPYGTGATLYIRPLLIGVGAEIGVRPANKYCFMVLVTPVGPYYKNGFSCVDLMVVRNFDRAATHGTGTYKVGGNYAASLQSLEYAHNKGYTTALYLDAKEKKYIDEAGTANFYAIKDNTYITPQSTSILPSITNKSLMQLAESEGIKVEQRKVPVEELNDFTEAGACGTAAVISPIASIYDPEKDDRYIISKERKVGEVSKVLYDKLTGIQVGEIEDSFGWVDYIDIDG
ncbi:branched-chain amino acid aminotransferase [Bacteroidales bacterium]|nr:branched-chain amino acid aminotransferase [Bacteroidales bacterium]